MTTTAGKSPTLEVAVCQLTSVDDVAANLSQIRRCLDSLASSPPSLVCFPENSLYLRVREGAPLPAVPVDHAAIRELSSWAREYSCVVHLGSVPLERDGSLFNSSLILLPDGQVRDGYQKIHLFDVDVEGAKPVRESDAFAPGREPSVFEVNGWRIGNSICYDLRFSELYSRYAKLEVDAILVPSAFLVPTGRAHWEILIRARAIENQAYVLAAAQGGVHAGVSGGSRSTYGHSMVVDPWGEVVKETPEPFTDEQRVLRATLRRDRIEQVRRQIPMKNHRRLS